MSLPPEPGSRGGQLALVSAWIIVVGLLAAAGGFVLVEGSEPLAPTAPKLVLALPPEPEEGPEPEASEPEPTSPAEPVALSRPAEGTSPAPGADTGATPRSESDEDATETAETAVAPAPGDPSPPEAGTSRTPTTEAEPPETGKPPETGVPPATAEPKEASEAAEQLASTEAAPEPAAPDRGTPLPEPAPAATPPVESEQLARLQVPAWRRFGSAAQTDPTRPRIAVVIVGLGQSAAATEAAIKNLPASITLSFSPYSRQLNQLIALARVNEHEVMLDLPMEPVTFPEDDPGPYALLTVLEAAENRRRLDWVLRRGNSYVGLAAIMGSRFSTSADHLRPVLTRLKERGLLYLDNAASADSIAPDLARQLELPFVVSDRMLDAAQASRVAINARLTELERLALEHGFAVAIGQPYPVTIERLAEWSAAVVRRGFDLVPITALVGQERGAAALSEQGQ